MNSRDAAYDEEEQLRRAIEASKEDTSLEEADLANRRPKRGREESEEYAKSATRCLVCSLTILQEGRKCKTAANKFKVAISGSGEAYHQCPRRIR